MTGDTPAVRASTLEPHSISTHTQASWILAWCTCGWIGPDRADRYQALADAVEHTRQARRRGEEASSAR